MPKKSDPNPDKLPKFVFPQAFIKQLSEMSRDGSFFLLIKDEDNEFQVIPHYTNQTDFLAMMTFLNVWALTSLENGEEYLRQEISDTMFGSDEEPTDEETGE